MNFILQAAGFTRVALEHRYFERAGETAEALRSGVDSPDGWSKSLERFAQAAAQ